MASDSFTNVEVVESRTEHYYEPICLTRGTRTEHYYEPICLTRGKGYSNKRLAAFNEI